MRSENGKARSSSCRDEARLVVQLRGTTQLARGTAPAPLDSPANGSSRRPLLEGGPFAPSFAIESRGVIFEGPRAGGLALSPLAGWSVGPLLVPVNTCCDLRVPPCCGTVQRMVAQAAKQGQRNLTARHARLHRLLVGRRWSSGRSGRALEIAGQGELENLCLLGGESRAETESRMGSPELQPRMRHVSTG